MSLQIDIKESDTYSLSVTKKNMLDYLDSKLSPLKYYLTAN